MKNVKKYLTEPTIRRAVSVVAVVCTVMALSILFTSSILPIRYSLLVAIGLALLCTIAVWLLTQPNSTRRRKIAGYIVAVGAVALSTTGVYAITSSLSLLSHVTTNSKVAKKNIDSTKPFNLYISGIDTYGDISTVSRSDVNIVATINPSTKHILLTTIPRDSYVAIAGGGNNQYDKLTHSGIYGIESSEQTVSTLLDSKIDNYVRINFSSFMDIIDGIGGVTVDNPVTFTTDGGQVFQKGNVYLNGKDALEFSRERHDLAGGDNDRGHNQERVVTAIFQKLISPSMIYHYQNVLDVIGRAVETNISQTSIISLVRQQLDNGGNWTFTSGDIGGKGETGQLPSYAMPSSQLYMFVLDQSSLQQARQRIKDALHVS